MAISEDAARDYLHDAAARAAPAPATAVIDRLYVGPFLYAKSLSWLRRHGITHVVNATPGAPCIHEAAGIVYLRISIEDRPGAPIGDHFEASRTSSRAPCSPMARSSSTARWARVARSASPART